MRTKQEYDTKHDNINDHKQYERLESVKAGILSGLAIAAIAGIGVVVNPEFMRLPTIALEVSIAGFSGGLFGITYRHLVSQGQDEHLKSGAIGAFALVRGLAQAELFWVYRENLWAVGIAIVESFVMFGVAALLLDFALKAQWIQPFTRQDPEVGLKRSDITVL